MTNNDNAVLEMLNIHKSFGNNKVLDGVNLKLFAGEVVGIVGENGAGKSTLIKILCGIYKLDQGKIILNGREVHVENASSAQKLGISTIYQELSVMPDLNATQNIFLNREIIQGQSLVSPLKEKQMQEIASKVLNETLKVNIDIKTPLKNLPLAQKQMVEIARTVYSNAQIIIMDEPTAALAAKEREQLFKVIRNLKSEGHSIIFISHHLDELIEICDRIIILRDGKKVSEGSINQYTIDQIISDMVGKELKNKYPKTDVPKGDSLLEVKNLSKKGFFQDISFNLHRGEIIGIAGLEGCGKNEVIRAIFGATNYDGGKIYVKGRSLPRYDIQKSINNGIAFVPAERKTDGLFMKQDLAWNISIVSLKKISKLATILKVKETKATEEYLEKLHIKAKGVRQNISALSGGNQQKVMLARWIMMGGDIFLMEEPTRGIDINAKTEVYEAIGECVNSGKGVIIVSSEEDELVGICDTILVMKQGRVIRVTNAKETTSSEIKSYAV